MAVSPILGWPLPNASDAPDGPTQMAALAAAAEKNSVMRFATTAARDAAVPTPTAGMTASTGTGAALVLWIHDGTTWTLAVSDTGWVPCVNVAGFTATTMSVRKIGGVIVVRGVITPTGSGTVTAAFVTFGTLPAGFAPGANLLLWPAACTSACAPVAQITTAGAVGFRALYGTGAAYTTSTSFAIAGGWTVD